MTYPSKLGLSFGGLAVMLYLVALQSQSGLLFLILGVVCGCYVINALAAALTARRLRLTPPDTIHGVEGQPVKGTWLVANASGGRTGLTEVRSPWGVLLRIGRLGPRAALHITPELTFPERGVYPFASLVLVSSYPFGLVRCRWRLRVAGEIVVYPAAYECASPAAAGYEPMVGGKFVGRNRSASGDRFHGVRPFRPQDPVKLIHWPSSSKGQGIMVKEFDEELSGRIAIVLAPSPARARDGSPLLNWAARAVASLMYAALDQGHQVEFIDLASQTPLSVPPFSDGRAVLEHLARLQPAPGALTRENLDKAVLQLPRKAALCFVLTSPDQDAIDHLRERRVADRRKIAVYLPSTAPPAREREDRAAPVHVYGAWAIGSS